MKDKDKVLALFNYISEISKNLKNTKTNIAEEKWFDFLENFPKHKDIIFEYKNLDEKYFENEEKRELTNYLPQIKIAGCPNSCATPQIAKLGFSGRRKKDGEYFAIFARGEFTGKTVKLNEIVGEIKASKIPYFLEDIANIIKNENIEFEKFANEDRFLGLIEDYKEIEVENVDFNEFRKIDAEKAW